MSSLGAIAFLTKAGELLEEPLGVMAALRAAAAAAGKSMVLVIVMVVDMFSMQSFLSTVTALAFYSTLGG